MSRRQRSAHQKVVRLRSAQAKTQRRRARRAATAAAAITLAGTGGVVGSAAAVGTTTAPRLLHAECGDSPTPGSDPENLTAFDGRMFFTAFDAVRGAALWRTDGTEAGTVLIKKLGSDSDGYDYDYGEGNLVATTSRLFFTVDTDAGQELWSSDGTKAGTVKVKRLPGDGGYYDGVDDMVAVGDRLFFTADDDVHGEELWTSNGTAAGTVMVKDISTDDEDSYYGGPRNLIAAGDALFFSADDGEHGEELWTSDGTAVGTVMVKDIRPGDYDSQVENVSAVGDAVFFSARNGTNGRELWTSDGTDAGTHLVADVHPVGKSSRPGEVVAAGANLFFFAEDATGGRDLWKTDGIDGATKVQDFAESDEYEEYYDSGDRMVALGDTVFFTADDGSHGWEPWSSDGTVDGAVMVHDIRAGDYGSEPRDLTVVGDVVYLVARDGAHGAELWRTDGAETALVEDINPRARGNEPSSLTALGDVLYFTADDRMHGGEVWKSDGTEAGTMLVADVNTGGAFDVSGVVARDTTTGTVRVVVGTDSAGTIAVTPAGSTALIKSAEYDISGPGRLAVTISPNKAALAILAKEDQVEVKAKFTFMSCGGATTSMTKRYTLKMR